MQLNACGMLTDKTTTNAKSNLMAPLRNRNQKENK